MRTTLSRVLCAAVIGATAAGVGTLYAAVEPVPGTPHAAVAQAEEDSPEWDCRTMGNRICGPLPVGTEVTVSGKPWVVTVSGLEPVSAN